MKREVKCLKEVKSEPDLVGTYGDILVKMSPFQAGEKMNLRTEVVTNYKIAQKMDFCSLSWGIYHIYLTSLVIKAEGIIKEEGSEFLCYRICGFPRFLFTMT